LTGIKTFFIFQRLTYVSYEATIYIIKFFVPFKLSAFYPFPNVHSSNDILLQFYISPIILLGIIGLLIYCFQKKKKEIVFGLLFYFISITPVLQFIPISPSIISDRYSYLSYIGILFIVAYIINTIWQSKNRLSTRMKYPLIVITIFSAALFSYQAYSRTLVWKDTQDLWSDVISKYPDVAMAYYGLAFYYLHNGDTANAMSNLNKDLQLSPFDKSALYDRGLLYYKHYNRTDLAIADFTSAIEVDTAFTYPYNSRGLAYLNAGKINLAMADFNKTIELDSTFAPAYNDRGTIYMNYGNTVLAIADFTKAIAYDSSSAICYYNRGTCYQRLNQYENAINDFTRGIRLNPPSIEAYYDMRGVCNGILKHYTDAIADFSSAIKVEPLVAAYWFNRSYAETQIGQYEISKSDALKAQQLQGR